ncbi:MAG: hypothetical protein IJM27_06080 [Eubacterium sp.]|nr:hypothetical protein [Eubacterium sp.]
MKIPKIELAAKIGKLKAIVPKKTPMAALQTVLLKDGCLIASDMEMTVQVKLEGISAGLEESFLIPESMFQLISNLPSGDVEITAKEIEAGMEMELKCGKIRNKFTSLSPEVYPAIKGLENVKFEIEVEAEKLLAGITHVLFAVDDGSGNQLMRTLNLSCANGYLNFKGLDGHMMAWDKVPKEGQFDINIPKRTCQQILNIDLQGMVNITSDGSTVRFETEYIMIESRLINGEFFKTDQLFQDMPLTAAVNRKAFVESLNRANLCRLDNDPIKLNFSGDKVRMELINSRNDYNEEIQLNDEVKEELRIGMDPRLLMAAIKSFDSENIYMEMQTARQPIKLLSDESDMKAIVLPVAIK